MGACKGGLSNLPGRKSLSPSVVFVSVHVIALTVILSLVVVIVIVVVVVIVKVQVVRVIQILSLYSFCSAWRRGASVVRSDVESPMSASTPETAVSKLSLAA